MVEQTSTGLSPLQRAFVALEESRARVAALEAAAREPIAVIGMGLRAPGGVTTVESFWRLLAGGVDAIGPLPEGRWDHDRYFDPNPDVPGRISTRWGGFIEGVDRFDAGFFGISPREADGMDPQQRLLLTVAWQALEHAGEAPDRLAGSSTGVFVGVTGSDYAYLQLDSGDEGLLDAHFASGIAHSIASGRISYLLGLQGPSLTIDTACSSSLVAIHQAVQSLRCGDCRLALAGGVNLILAPEIFVSLSRARMLSPDGRCKAFAASANGFARAEGCGVIVLKRLSDALADGNRVLAVVRGSMVNQDGASSSLTAPNGPAQEAVIRGALSRAGLRPDEVGFIEAHGTGTELGDPIEAKALGAVFKGRHPSNPLYLGSVKTNIGHAEAAAGVLGVIKAVLALHHRAIPAHLHFGEPSPHIPWDTLPLRVPRELTAWESERRRIAGVSSFGFSGTNAHVVLEERTEETTTPRRERMHVVSFSARSGEALADWATQMAGVLAGNPETPVDDIVRTINRGRATFQHRAAILAPNSPALASSLIDLSAGRVSEKIRTGQPARRDPPRIAFLFTGQGSQYPGMARGLYEDEPVFREAIDRCAALLEPHMGRDLRTVVFSDAEGTLDRTEYTQPALLSIEYALGEVWKSWGVQPSVVIGHSVGEYAAAVAAGILELPDALRLIAKRGRLMQSLPPGGGMAAVFGSEALVSDAISSTGARLSIAAANGPLQTVVSGPLPALDNFCAHLAATGVKTTRLAVSHAFHSELVEPVLPDFEREATTCQFSAPRLRLISNLTGRSLTKSEAARPQYWRDHMRQPVRFAEGLRALAEAKPDICIEIGPNPSLISFASAVFDAPAPLLLPSLRKGRDDREQMLDSLAQACGAGANIDWRGVCPTGRVIDLPGHPMQPERHWFHARPRTKKAACHQAETGLPGRKLSLATPAVVFEATLSADQPPYLRQHRVQDHIVVPATAYLAAIPLLMDDLFPGRPFSVRDIAIREAMLLAEDGCARTVQTVVEPRSDGGSALRVMSREGDEGPWTLHVDCTLKLETAALPVVGLDDARADCPTEHSPQQFYASFEALGLQFGDAFRTVRTRRTGRDMALGEVRIADGLEHRACPVHPVLLDGCLQVAAAAMGEPGRESLYLPVGIGEFAVHGAAGSSCFSHIRVGPAKGDIAKVDVTLYSPDGEIVATLREVQFKRVQRDALARLSLRWLDESLYEIAWTPAEQAASWSVAFDTHRLVAQVLPTLPDLAARAGIAEHDRASAELEELCVDFAFQSLARLGLQLAPGTFIREDGLADVTGIASRHRRLFARLFTILESGGLLRREGDGWRVVQGPRADPDERARRMMENEPSIRSELEMTTRAAPHLAEALRGRRDEADLLFPGGSTENAERLYRDSPTARLFNGLMAKLAEAAAAARTGGRPLRVLEVGGGTGGTTAHVLPLLPDDAEYTFTDIGPLFVARAKERFGADKRVRFATLDLDRDFPGSGVEGGPFDVVIASNVVHATAELRRTLSRLRGTLATGGLLLMLEVTQPQHWFDLTVGLTEGWWAFTDTDLRTDYPTLSRERWVELLGECGFESISTLPDRPPPDGALSRQSILVARSRGPAWLLIADETGIAEALAERLRGHGCACTLVRHGAFALRGGEAWIDLANPGDIGRLLDELAAAGRSPDHVLHAGSLDIAPDANPAQAAGRGVVAAMHVAKALVTRPPAPRLWLLTRGAQEVGGSDHVLTPLQAPVWGLGRSLAVEHPELRCTCIDIDEMTLDLLASALAEGVKERDLAFRSGQRKAARIRRMRLPKAPTEPGSPWRLGVARPGSIEAFQRSPIERPSPGPGEVEIAVEATGLNFKDVLNALDMYPGNPGPLGGECAGRVVAVGAGVAHVAPSDPVMAITAGAFASHVIARASLVQRRPEKVGPEEGATFPIAFVTAAFCLDHIARLRSNETVLVHAAAGGVGLAAVQLARRIGARVLATAGSPAKRALLTSLGVEHVFDSRTDAFVDGVRRATDGRGVDVVLNSLGGNLVEASFRAIAEGGRFVEIGKRGIKTPEWVDALGRGIRYDIVDWGDTAERDPDLIGRLFAGLAAALAEGRLTPLPRHTFQIEQAAQAFRLMARAGHVGRIAVSHAPTPPALARPDGTYLITGGLSGLGLEVARHLADRGAGRLVLLGRRKPGDDAAQAIEAMRGAGTEVVVANQDVTDEPALLKLLGTVRASGPALRGVLHAAGVLSNGALTHETEQSLRRVLAPKVEGAALLDRLTRVDPLDWFVLFSSIASLLGAAGQANHAAANAYLDQLAHQRRATGLPGLSINWGAWSEVGAAAALQDQLSGLGVGFLTPAQGFAAFERLTESGIAQAAVVSIDWQRYRSQIAPGVHASLLTEFGHDAPLLTRQDKGLIDPRQDFLAEANNAPPSRRLTMVSDFVRRRLLAALGMEQGRAVDPQAAFGDLGLDSLLSVELRNVIGVQLGRSFPATLLFDYPTIETLSEFLVRDLWGSAEPYVPEAPGDLVEGVEELSDDDVDRLLRSRFGVSI